MSLFRRKKPKKTAPIIDDATTDGATTQIVNIGLDAIDRQIEEKKVVKETAHRLRESAEQAGSDLKTKKRRK